MRLVVLVIAFPQEKMQSERSILPKSTGRIPEMSARSNLIIFN